MVQRRRDTDLSAAGDEDRLRRRGGCCEAQSLRVLADYLERHPEALIQGKAKD
jgi:hypothetical protein